MITVEHIDTKAMYAHPSATQIPKGFIADQELPIIHSKLLCQCFK